MHVKGYIYYGIVDIWNTLLRLDTLPMKMSNILDKPDLPLG